MPKIDPSEKYSFAGSDALQAQITLGAPADLFLAASNVGPDALYAAGKCQKPVTFVRNRLVLAVPANNPAGITSIYDLKRPGVRVLIGTATVPIGSYTRQILRNFGLLNAILPQVVSQEKDVATIAAKLKLGAADAGFVYVTDALAAGHDADGDLAAHVGAAARQVRGLCRHRVAEPGCRCRAAQEPDHEAGPGQVHRCRVPAAEGAREAGQAGQEEDEEVGWTGMRPGRLAFTAFLFVTTFLTLAFLVVPVVSIFWKVPPRTLIDQLGSSVVLDALRVTAEVNLIALAILLVIGTPASYLLATRRFWGRPLVITLVELPLVLPPAVAGIGLLVAFLPDGPIGRFLHPLGVDFIFTEAGVVLAVLFVGSPFFLRAAIAAFEDLDEDTLAAARTLGAGPGRVFARIAVPLALPGLSAGAALAFGRGVGEFGATIMFAGNLQGTTQTLPLAIYSAFETDLPVTLAISALLVVFSGTILLGVKLLVAWASSRSNSPFPSAASASS